MEEDKPGSQVISLLLFLLPVSITPQCISVTNVTSFPLVLKYIHSKCDFLLYHIHTFHLIYVISRSCVVKYMSSSYFFLFSMGDDSTFHKECTHVIQNFRNQDKETIKNHNFSNQSHFIPITATTTLHYHNNRTMWFV